MSRSEPTHWPLAVLDWGTSNLRAYCVDEAGTILGQVSRDAGVKTMPEAGYPVLVQQLLADLAPPAPIRHALLVGMVGSELGWRETPMRPAPASLSDLAHHLNPVPGHPCRVIPGVSALSVAGLPDMMRGEETQVLGALAETGQTSGLFCLPGTHCKWVQCDDGRITRITTAMTGELFDLLTRHSVLRAQTGSDDTEDDLTAFDEGVQTALTGLGAAQLAFSVRPRALVADKSGAASARSYLSGILIGAELQTMQAHQKGSALTIIGAPALTRAYARACVILDIKAKTMDGATAVSRGAALIHHHWLGDIHARQGLVR
ncbi:2-dehydro-3-deoxygalactonokinase [Ruegeria jejuensis]|uniref:2-dehydro-3-deoxygalactonokinase n=1 Tax=Ruegeria jejuensis TaxID=3233338 RepID=UPI00355ADA2B